jgi:hypothetical protein
MYRVPESTTRRLRNEFRDRIRIRWSDRSRTFHVEGKSHRGFTDLPIPAGLTAAQERKFLDIYWDDLTRARDGYQLIMEIQPGARMKCPREGCHVTLKVPINRTAEVACEYCKSLKLDGRTIATYYDLESEALIERLRYLDPERAWRDESLRKGMERRNAKVTQDREDDALNFIGAVNRDEYRNFAGIQQTGTSTKTGAWVNAPESPLLRAS